jgi:hypothetical protein
MTTSTLARNFSLMRCAVRRRTRWLLTLCVVLMVGFSTLAEPAVAADANVSFDIAEAVSIEDATYVREGIALAQRYVAETLTDISDAPIRVAVFADDDFFCGEEAIACANESSIVVLTDTPDWNSLAPFERVETVVHEYIHVYQFAKLEDQKDIPPTWFIEGMAEYLAFDAVVKQGLVSANDVRDFETGLVAQYPELSPLEEFEDRGAFYSEPGPVYSLAYMAIAEMMNGHSPSDLDRLLEQVESSHNWRGSFLTVFGQGIGRFYQSFAETREDLPPLIFLPKPFTLLTPQFFESPIHITTVMGPFEEGEQMTVLGSSDASAVCRIRLLNKQSGQDISQTTYADGSGHLFWLITIPDTFGEGIGIITAACGGEPQHVAIDITD